jgi:hypothetical protein
LSRAPPLLLLPLVLLLLLLVPAMEAAAIEADPSCSAAPAVLHHLAMVPPEGAEGVHLRRLSLI